MSPGLSWMVMGTLIFAALLIAYLVWMRHVRREYLEHLVKHAKLADLARFLDDWERPKVITSGGIWDYEKDGSGL